MNFLPTHQQVSISTGVNLHQLALQPPRSSAVCRLGPVSTHSSGSSRSSSGSGRQQNCCCHALPPLPTPSSHSSSSRQVQYLRQRVIPAAGFGFGKSKAAGNKANSKDCPCGSGKLYSKCCEVFHKSAAAHPDPERLVKARYSAFVKKQPRFLRATSHPDNPALQGSSTTLEDGTVKKCSYEEDLAISMVYVEYTGFEVLGCQLSQDGSSCSVDSRATYKRLVDSSGKRIGKPQEAVWMERATLLKGDDGNWLVRDVHPIEPAATAAAAAAAEPAVESS